MPPRHVDPDEAGRPQPARGDGHRPGRDDGGEIGEPPEADETDRQLLEPGAARQIGEHERAGEEIGTDDDDEADRELQRGTRGREPEGELRHEGEDGETRQAQLEGREPSEPTSGEESGTEPDEDRGWKKEHVSKRRRTPPALRRLDRRQAGGVPARSEVQVEPLPDRCRTGEPGSRQATGGYSRCEDATGYAHVSPSPRGRICSGLVGTERVRPHLIQRAPFVTTVARLHSRRGGRGGGRPRASGRRW